MIIDAAARGEDLGPTGALWQAAGPTAVERGRRRLDGETVGALSGGGSVLVDAQAYELMRTLRDAGVPTSTVLRLALRAADAGRQLAQEISAVLTEATPRQSLEPVPDLPDLAVLNGGSADVIDLATTITRGVLSSSNGLAHP